MAGNAGGFAEVLLGLGGLEGVAVAFPLVPLADPTGWKKGQVRVCAGGLGGKARLSESNSEPQDSAEETSIL